MDDSRDGISHTHTTMNETGASFFSPQPMHNITAVSLFFIAFNAGDEHGGRKPPVLPNGQSAITEPWQRIDDRLEGFSLSLSLPLCIIGMYFFSRITLDEGGRKKRTKHSDRPAIRRDIVHHSTLHT